MNDVRFIEDFDGIDAFWVLFFATQEDFPVGKRHYVNERVHSETVDSVYKEKCEITRTLLG